MLSKKSIKILTTIMLVVMMLVTFSNVAFAASATAFTPDTTGGLGGMEGVVKKVLGVIKIGGIAIAVGVLMFIGIKYITASPDGKAEVKKTILYYVLGLALLLSAVTVVSFLESNLG